MFNLRNRSFLKELDFTPDELRFLLKLSAALKIAKYGGYEQARLEGKEIALIFEKTSTRTMIAFEVAAYDQGAHVTYLGPSGLADRPQGVDEGHGPGAGPDVRRHRVPRLRPGDVETLARVRGRARVERPDRRVPPDADPRRHADDDRAQRQAPTTSISYCLLGDARNNMGNSLHGRRVQCWAWTSASSAPQALWPADDLVKTAPRHRRARPAPGSPSPTTSTRAVAGVDFVHTDVWVSMGEDEGRVGRAHRAAAALPGQRRAARQDRQPEGEVHALPAGVPRPEHASGERSSEHTGMRRPRGHRRRLRVAGQSSCSTRPRTACTRSRRSSSPRSGAEARPCASSSPSAATPC